MSSHSPMSLSSDNSSDFHWAYPAENVPQSTTMYPPIKPLDVAWGRGDFHWAYPVEKDNNTTTMYPPILTPRKSDPFVVNRYIYYGSVRLNNGRVEVHHISKTPVYHVRIFSGSGDVKSKWEIASSAQEAAQLALTEM